jgi:hypothetical protein
MSIGKRILGGLGFAVGGPIGAVIGVMVASAFESGKHIVDAQQIRPNLHKILTKH